MIEVRVPENQAYEWSQAHKERVRVVRRYTDSIKNERVFVIDYISTEMHDQDRAKRIANEDWSNQHWAVRGKKTFMVWRANEGCVWDLHPAEFLGWLNGFEDDHDFMMDGYDFIEVYLRAKSGKSVCVAPTWYCVDYDNHPNPNFSKKQSYTLPRWAQKLVAEKNVTKESALEFLSKSWLT